MSDIDTELLEVMREEVAEGLEDFSKLLESLTALSGNELREGLHRAFRIMHNVKGGARMVGLSVMEALAHTLEEALDGLRKQGIPPATSFVAKAQESVSVLLQLTELKPVDDKAMDLVAALTELAGDQSGAPEAPVENVVAPAAPTPIAATPAAPTSPSGAEVDDVVDSPQPSGAQVEESGIQAQSRGGAGSVRVETSRLDRLMGFTGELLILHERQNERHRRLGAFQDALQGVLRRLPSSVVEQFEGIVSGFDELLQGDRNDAQRFGYVTEDFGDVVKRVRMLPLQSMAAGWRRTLTESASEIGRSVRFDAELGDVELDKQILDGIRDPVMHLLRNAVAHGIESPEERRAAGKAERGIVRMSATTDGSHVYIEVEDDGRGIRADRVIGRAMERGLLKEEEAKALDEDGIINLLFTPGFSTAETVGKISGRGVGLDVVRSRVGALGGTVAVTSKGPGQGVMFRIAVPVSLVSTKGLMVKTDAGTYAFPMTHVERTVRVATESVHTVDGVAAAAQENGQPLRLRWLAAVMGENREVDPKLLTVVIVTNGTTRMGLVVGAVLGEQEFVTKRLPWNLRRVAGVGGAVIVGGGMVVPVVDVPQLFGEGGVVARGADEQVKARASTRASRVLVVDDSLTSRTLERNILRAAGYDVEVAVDGEAGWAKLQAEGFDLVVSDVEMPQLNGFELCARIRGNPQTKNTPVILVTSLDSSDDLARGAEAGADEYIVKGKFEQRKLLDAVARLL